jgi:putative ABC transport system permease protein
VASALGVVLGIGLGTGGAAMIASADNASLGPVTVTATPVVVGLLVGMVVTLVAALLPARAATRVPPIAALRHQTEGPVRGRAGAARLTIGGLSGLGGVALVGLALESPAGPSAFLLVMAGAIVLFFGVVALSPLLVRFLSGVIGRLPARLFGVPGRLARENARRNPKRAAITTIALTVGVTLMTMFSVALTSTEKTAEAKLTAQFPVDYRLTAQVDSDRLIPRQVAATLRTKPQIADVIEERRASGRLSGHKLSIGAITDGSLGRSIKPEVVAGTLADMRPGSVALSRGRARTLGVGVGGHLVLGAGARAFPLRVAALVTDDAPVPSVTVTEEDFQRAFGVKQDTEIAVIVKKGVSPDESRRVVEAAARPYAMVKVASIADMKGEFTKALNQLFVLVGALLGLAIVISLIGIANTLTLSVVERTRESALLRALGLTRRGLRWMLSLEAVLMAVIGALMGVVLGTAFGWLALSANFDGAVLGFPALRVAAFVLGAGLAGLLAAVVPGRRAAKAPIVESLASD